ncbi:MAG: RNA polymerase sigma factor, partial [Gemmataceae bacterium]
MVPGQFGAVLRRIRHVFGVQEAEEQADSRLLERFAADRDEAAFGVLLQRHGPMVLRLCRSILHHEQDAEDAFQATFLVLAQKCASIRQHHALASWLYGVAYRLCLRAKSRQQRRQAKLEHEPATPAPEADMQETHAILYEELAQLPDRYRQPLLLCYFQGMSHGEACGELGLARGSMTYRLKVAEEQLRKRLARRGVTLSVAMLASLAGGASALPPALVDGTLKAAVVLAAGEPAGNLISSQVVTLTRGGMQMLFWQKAKRIMVAGTGLALLTAVVGWTFYQNQHQTQAVPV